ncbi:MAG: cytochrome c-type biogenesis protein [Usitatibacter sp.]
MRLALAAALLTLQVAAAAQSPGVANPDPAVERRLRELGEELRCLVCQNQTIADSSAPLAVDLRNQLRGQIAQGRSNDEIRGYMVDRYGDFVLYRPPLRARTALLWLGPFLMVAIGAGVFFFVVRRRSAGAPTPLTDERRGELESLLAGAAPPAPSAPLTPNRERGRS